MSDAPELKPCPFCGGEAWLNDYEAKHGGMPARSRCPQCKSCGCSLWYHPTESKAIAAWNRRADLVPAPSVTVKPLEWDCDFAAVNIPEGYSTYENGDDEWSVYLTWRTGSEKLHEAGHQSLDAAKAAAQADYEARIMAAIQIAPAPPSEVNP